MAGAEKFDGGAGPAEMLAGCPRQSWVVPPTDRGLNAVKPLGTGDDLPPFERKLPVPGAPFVKGAAEADLNEAGVGTGGRTGSDGCGCGVEEVEKLDVFIPGGAG